MPRPARARGMRELGPATPPEGSSTGVVGPTMASESHSRGRLRQILAAIDTQHHNRSPGLGRSTRQCFIAVDEPQLTGTGSGGRAAFGPCCKVVAPLGGAQFGARVDGVDLSRRLSSRQAAWLQQLLWEHGVLCVSGQHALPAGGLERLANYFGAPVPAPAQVANGGQGLLPQVLRSDGSSGNSAAGWHTDLNFHAEPCTVTMLHCLVAPLKGGQTHFASTSRGYDSLPAAERSELTGLKVAHMPRPFFDASMQMDPAMTNVQPLVRPQPQTGRLALYLPAEDFYSPQSVAGWTLDTPLRRQGLADGGGLVGELLEVGATAADRVWHPPHRPDGSDLLELAGFDRLRELMMRCVCPENTCSHRWEEGDVVMWDNAVVLHRADILGLPGQGLRLLHRVSVKGQPVTSLPRDCDSVEWLVGASTPFPYCLNLGKSLAEAFTRGQQSTWLDIVRRPVCCTCRKPTKLAWA